MFPSTSNIVIWTLVAPIESLPRKRKGYMHKKKKKLFLLFMKNLSGGLEVKKVNCDVTTTIKEIHMLCVVDICFLLLFESK